MKNSVPESATLSSIGRWAPGAAPLAADSEGIVDAAARFREQAYVAQDSASGRIGVGLGGQAVVEPDAAPSAGHRLLAILPPVYPEWLGARGFCEAHRTRFAYVAGEMANGIATTDLVIAVAKAGMLGFFGAAGLKYELVDEAVDRLQAALGDTLPWGVNLIHSPNEAALENSVADLLIRRRVTRVSASAFMSLTPAVVRYAASGLRVDDQGRVVRRNCVFAKLSRPEVAKRFMSPPPRDMLQALVSEGLLTEEEARLAGSLPVAEDVTVEADSGGHTDNQTLTALFPTIAAQRDALVEELGYTRPIRLGAAGGLGTPGALAAAFGLGAEYVVTGSINQSACEAGLSVRGRQLLAQAQLGDMAMAPAADMFELGVDVQVLKRGTMFASRARRLYEAYDRYPSLDAIPAALRARLEKEVFQASFEQIWNETRDFWRRRDPDQAARAERDEKQRMALVFRWYLGKSSRWAIDGDPDRILDYQIWCGPAMGAFNLWVKGSFLANPENREAAQVGLNLLEGAAAITRAQQLRAAGVAVPTAAFHYRPRPLGVQPRSTPSS